MTAQPESIRARNAGRWMLWVCAVLYLWTAPGRILFPDDEIVFQTTRAIYERGSLEIEGIPRRTGELEGRPDGTFGWAPGAHGERYGFFGHALAIAALPGYAIGKLGAQKANPKWRHALRSDHYYLHARSQEADWTRFGVTLTNVWITPLAAWLLMKWLVAIGFQWRTSTWCALVYATGTLAWPYSRTFLSEPLSAAVLVGCAWCIAEVHRGLDDASPLRARRWAIGAGTCAAIAVHVHVLNVIALPCLLAYALWSRRDALRTVAPGLVVAALGVLLLLVGQWLRFGNAFETGRYDHYSWWIVPGEGTLATLVGPGRSFFLYALPIVLAIPMWPTLKRRMPAVAWLVLAICVTRWLIVVLRSDWWGGWSIGPRYLVPVIPFAIVPLAIVIERLPSWSRARRLGVYAVLAIAVAISLHLALHSIFEHMLHLTTTGSPEFSYLRRSHWLPGSSPLVGFATLPYDTLSGGVIALAKHGHTGPLWFFALVLASGVFAAVALVRALVWHAPAAR